MTLCVLSMKMCVVFYTFNAYPSIAEITISVSAYMWTKELFMFEYHTIPSIGNNFKKI